jgi:hypothetical protein
MQYCDRFKMLIQCSKCVYFHPHNLPELSECLKYGYKKELYKYMYAIDCRNDETKCGVNHKSYLPLSVFTKRLKLPSDSR